MHLVAVFCLVISALMRSDFGLSDFQRHVNRVPGSLHRRRGVDSCRRDCSRYPVEVYIIAEARTSAFAILMKPIIAFIIDRPCRIRDPCTVTDALRESAHINLGIEPRSGSIYADVHSARVEIVGDDLEQACSFGLAQPVCPPCFSAVAPYVFRIKRGREGKTEVFHPFIEPLRTLKCFRVSDRRGEVISTERDSVCLNRRKVALPFPVISDFFIVRGCGFFQ